MKRTERNQSSGWRRAMSDAIEEIYWTAKEWALRTRIPYRTILGAHLAWRACCGATFRDDTWLPPRL